VLDKRTSEETSSVAIAAEKEEVVAYDNKLEDMIILGDGNNSRVSGGTRILLQSEMETLILEDDI